MLKRQTRPVWLDIPLDIQGAMIDTHELKHYSYDDYEEIPPKVTPEIAQDILEKIKNAKAPLVLAGSGINLSGAQSELLELIQKLNIPVVTAWASNDTVAFDNPCFAGMPGTLGTRGGNFCVQNCDLILSLGSRLNIRMVSYNKLDFAKNAYKIIVDIDPKELKKPTIIPDMPIHADVKDLISQLLQQEYVRPEVHNDWLFWAKEINNKYPAVKPEYYDSNKNINPYVFIDDLFCRLNNQDIISCGNGSACVVTFQAGKIKQGQRMFANSGCAAMGYGLPAALGAAAAAPEKRVICIEGDGSFMMNMQEMQTISYNKLNIKIFIINNNGYHSIRQTQTNLFKPPLVGVNAENGVSFPDFKKLSEAFGVEYFTLSIRGSNTVRFFLSPLPTGFALVF